MQFANIFSLSVACLYILLPELSSEQKFFLVSMKSSLIIFSCMDCAFTCLRVLHLAISPESVLYFILKVLHLKSMIHFELLIA